MNLTADNYPTNSEIWNKVCAIFHIRHNWYDQYHWIYRDDTDEIMDTYAELCVDRCNQVIQTYLQEVI
ncbi:MAG: hypothetical protein K6F61_04155 [Clostridiales bacterium]|nr:hypothetical protein [Clostridiales bacterium]